MNKLTVYSERSLSESIGEIRELFEIKKYFTLTIKIGKKRSIDQNWVMHGWFQQIANELREYTADHIKCQCKYHLGVPILRAEDEEFNRKCKLILDPLPYETRIEAMSLIQVTSIMSTDQLSEFMGLMQDNYADRVQLKFKEKKKK